MYLYIARRDLKYYFSQNCACGGVPVNNDYRFTAIKDGLYYLLTLNNANYAVSKEDGDKFIEDVKSKCTGEHRGSFPLVPSLNGRDTAAVVEMEREVDIGNYKTNQNFYYDMDDEVLFQMMEDLRSRSGEPLDKRALMNYCYPNPVLPEGDYELNRIHHGIYCKEEPVGAGVIRTFFPDKRISCFGTGADGAYVDIREEDTENTYKVPAELIPVIKEKVRELCREPAEAYAEHGDWEGYIRFGKDDERIFTDPEKTLALLKEIASQSTFDSSREVDKKNHYQVSKMPDGGFPGFGMTGMSGFMGMPLGSPVTQAPATPAETTQKPAASDGKKCSFCGADVTGMKFCPECGGVVQQ